MNDKVKRVLSTLTLSALVATNAAALMPKVASAAEVEVEKLAGATRYETADKINAKLGDSFENVILTSGENENLVDALAAAPLAKKLGAPIVIINPKTAKAQDVVAKLENLGAQNVYVVTGAIKANVISALKDAGMDVKNLGGANRFETAYNIAKELGDADAAVVVNGITGLADAMSIAPVAAAKGWPIVLATKDDVNDTYKGNYAKYYVIGGTGALSAKVEDEVDGERIFGANRYETNLNVIKKFKSDINFENIFIARGENANLVDALVGAAVAASQGSAIVLVNDTITDAVKTELKAVKGIEKAKYTIFGGTVSTSAIKTAAEEIAKAPEVVVDEATVNTVSEISVKLNNPINAENPDMTLVGNAAQVLVKAVDKDGKAVAGVPVLFEKVKQYGTNSGKFEQSVVYTDKDGIAVGFLKLENEKGDASTVLYKASVVGKDVKPVEGKVQFAKIAVDAVKVVDGDKDKLNPSLNADSIYKYARKTTDMNGVETQYVASQKVSKAGTDENKVTFEVKPTLKYYVESAKETVDTYKKVIDEKSGQYHPYTDWNSKEIEVPSGLKYATLYLKSLQLDENAKLKIHHLKADGSVMRTKEIVGPRTETNVAIQIPENEISDVSKIRVQLITAGQVNTKYNGGVEIDRIEGVFKTNQGYESKTVELKNASINWEVDEVVYSETKTLTNPSAYGINEENGKKFVYQVPVFPYTGNAIVTVYDENNKVLNYYAIPTVNDGNENKIVAPATNVAIKISKDEAFNKVGTPKPENNGFRVVVNSEKVGITNLKGKITVPGVSSEVLNATNSTVYTSVAWAPLTKSAATTEETSEKLFALNGQKVEIVAQLMDGNGNIATVKGQQVQLKVKETIGNVNWTSNLSATTDDKGQARWSVSSGDLAILKEITAENSSYDIKLTIGGKEVKKADIRWVSAYLTHQAVVDGQVYKSTDNIPTFEYNVGESIEYGFMANATARDMKVKIGKIPVTFNKVPGTVGNAEKVADLTYVYLGKSETAGLQMVETKFDNITNVNGVELKYSTNEKDYLPGTFVGTGATSITDKIVLSTKYKTVGSQFDVIVPQGNVANIGTTVKVYVKLKDSYGNPLSGKQVKFTVTGIGATTETPVTSNTNGVVVIPVVNNGVVGESTVKVEYNGEAKYYSINWKNLQKDFAMVSATANTTGNNDVVILTFSNVVKADTIKAKQFKVKAANGTYYAIKDVQVQDNIVKLTLDDSNAKLYNKEKTTYSVEYTPYTVSEGEYAGIEFAAVDTDGKVLDTSNIEFEIPSNVIIDSVGVDTTNNVLEATILNANGKRVFVVDSNGKVYSNSNYVVTNNKVTIPVGKALVYRVYCNGVEKVYTLTSTVNIDTIAPQVKSGEATTQSGTKLPITVNDNTATVSLNTLSGDEVFTQAKFNVDTDTDKVVLNILNMKTVEIPADNGVITVTPGDISQQFVGKKLSEIRSMLEGIGNTSKQVTITGKIIDKSGNERTVSIVINF